MNLGCYGGLWQEAVVKADAHSTNIVQDSLSLSNLSNHWNSCTVPWQYEKWSVVRKCLTSLFCTSGIWSENCWSWFSVAVRFSLPIRVRKCSQPPTTCVPQFFFRSAALWKTLHRGVIEIRSSTGEAIGLGPCTLGFGHGFRGQFRHTFSKILQRSLCMVINTSSQLLMFKKRAGKNHSAS